MKNAQKKEIAAKLAARIHTSTSVAALQIPYLQVMFQKGAGNSIVEELDLDEEEVGWLKGR